MKATLWISGRDCRIIILDAEGRIVDLCRDWNNIASAQSWLNDAYPEAAQIVVRDANKRKEMDLEWDRCTLGVG